MHIHWFPGHMTKAFRSMQEQMKLVTSVIYVLDARAPMSSTNPEYDKLINTKPTLYILNKADLVDQNDVLEWKKFFERHSKKCVIAVSTQQGSARAEILSALKEINSEFLQRHLKKGVRKSIRAMVIGVPNCGKSTLVNSLLGKKKTITGNRPGVTKGRQWVMVDKYIELMDTPGTLYPDFKDQKKARNLAFIGSISDDVVDSVELAGELISFLQENYSNRLKNRYDIDFLDTENLKNLEEIGKKRGFIVRGGDVDIEKTAKAVIIDFRKNAFGKVILEKQDEFVKV